MPSMFRSPQEASSSESESSSEEAVGDQDQDVAVDPLEPQMSATESIEEQIDRTALPISTIEQDWLSHLDPNGHANMMTAGLLEFYSFSRAAEILNARDGQGRYTRESPEAQSLGRRLFAYKTQQLSSHGWVAHGIDGEELSQPRQRYRDLLDQICIRALEEGTDATFEHSSISSMEQRLQAMQLQASHPSTNIQLIVPRIDSTRFLPSRYAVEFSEVKLLGKGGYGKVFHVTNHIDGQHYAIKKIPLSPRRLKKLQDGGRQELETILKEIRTLARLEHSNVVRYFGAWIERTDAALPSLPRIESSSLAPLSDSPADGENEKGPAEGDASFGVVFEDSGDQRDGIVFEKSSENDEELQTNAKADPQRRGSQATTTSTFSRKSFVQSYGAEDDEIESIPRDFGFPLASGQTSTVGVAEEDIFTDGAGGRSQVYDTKDTAEGPSVVLHIQMSLHPMSLATYLALPKPVLESAETRQESFHSPASSRRHCFHLVPSLQLLLKILSGVEYLHSQGIVHRDLKPGNIFLGESSFSSVSGCIDLSTCPDCFKPEVESSSGMGRATRYTTPRIGDFGLVAEISRLGTIPGGAGPPDIASNRRVGTEFYRPPAKTTSRVDEKIDVFALGVLLFELLWKFETRMERHMVLADLNNGVLPLDLTKRIIGPKIGVPDGVRPDLVENPAYSIFEYAESLVECLKGMVNPAAEERWTCVAVRQCLEGILAGQQV